MVADHRRLPPAQLLLVTAWDASRRAIEFISPSPRLATALAAEYGAVESRRLGPDEVFTLHISLLYDFEDVLSFLTALAGLAGTRAIVHDW